MFQFLKSSVEEALSLKYGKRLSVLNFSPVPGGSINACYRIETELSPFFIKINDVSKYPGMFTAEKKGLELLTLHSAFKVPELIILNEDESNSFLVLEFIEQETKNERSLRTSGNLLAEMHKQSSRQFGLDHDNYIGSLKQTNNFHDSWADFFIEERLSVQLKLAYDQDRLNRNVLASFEKLYKQLPDLFPSEPPSLLHGDLWNGNFIIATGGLPCIFDPAVYYGHREMDLAMTTLFGGFSDEFYQAYNENFPLEKAWKERTALCNLYPLLVHVNLFGGGYVREVEMILKRFA